MKRKRNKNKCICGRRLPCRIMDPLYYAGLEKRRKFKERKWKYTGLEEW